MSRMLELCKEILGDLYPESLDTEDAGGPKPARGGKIFPDPSEPTTFEEIVGQAQAKDLLTATVRVALLSKRRLPHILLAAGAPGVAKSTMARVTAHAAGAGVIEMTGKVTIEDAQRALRSMRDGDVLFLDEALALDTPIPTPTGWTTVGEIKVGDQILSPSGKAVEVSRLTAIKTDARCYRVTFRDGTSIVADAGHKWLASRRVKGGTGYVKPQVVTTQEMVDSGTNWRVPLPEPIDPPPADLPLDPYVLGQWLGNGSAGQTYIHVRTELAQATGDEMATRGWPSTVRPGCADSIVRLGMAAGHRPGRNGPPSPFRRALEALGIYHTKAIPGEYLRGSIQQRLDLLRGLMDTDGHVDKSGYCVFANTNQNILDGVVDLVRSLGWVATKNLASSATARHKEVWKVGFRPRGMSPFLVRPVTIPGAARKGEKLIASIEPVTSVPVRCIEVNSADHLFLAGAYTVTHNCHLLFTSGRRADGEWLLTLMQDGRLVTAAGSQKVPDVAVIGATTDVEKIPPAVLSRFRVQPVITEPTGEDMVGITRAFSARDGMHLDEEMLDRVARAACHSPRQARAILEVANTYGQLDHADPVGKALQVLSLTPDGLGQKQQDYLMALGVIAGGTASVATMAGHLQEPGGINRIEQPLLRLGLIEIKPNGRTITKLGRAKLAELINRK